MVQFVIDNAVVTLVQVAMHAMARIDFLQGGEGIVSIVGGRSRQRSAGDPSSADDLSDATGVA
jgi:hypothetical protein